MTGAYVRVERDGEWMNIEIDRLTDEELAALEVRYMADGGGAGAGWVWARFLARWIRDNVTEPETPPPIVELGPSWADIPG